MLSNSIGSAPLLSSQLTARACPCLQAIISGVCPYVLRRLTHRFRLLSAFAGLVSE